eukprot:754216-Hanusia_phi.AAC.1
MRQLLIVREGRHAGDFTVISRWQQGRSLACRAVFRCFRALAGGILPTVGMPPRRSRVSSFLGRQRMFHAVTFETLATFVDRHGGPFRSTVLALDSLEATLGGGGGLGLVTAGMPWPFAAGTWLW